MTFERMTLLGATLLTTCAALLSGCAAEPGEEEAATVTSEVTGVVGVPRKGGETARTTTALNLRSGPSTDHAVTLVMPEGASITYARDAARVAKNGYVPVYYGDIGGWAYGAYLAKSAAEQGGEQSESATPAVYGMGCVGRATASYCGGNFGVEGDPNVLFRCENGYRKTTAYCRGGCISYNWTGSPDDHCR